MPDLGTLEACTTWKGWDYGAGSRLRVSGASCNSIPTLSDEICEWVTALQRSRSVGTARCTLGGGLNAVIRARAGEWLQRPVYAQSLGTHLPPLTNRVLAMLTHLRLGRLACPFPLRRDPEAGTAGAGAVQKLWCSRCLARSRMRKFTDFPVANNANAGLYCHPIHPGSDAMPYRGLG